MNLTLFQVRRVIGVSFSFSFQFFTRLAAVFAEELGDFGMFRPFLQTSDGKGKSLCA